jgi:hypothetical protein
MSDWFTKLCIKDSYNARFMFKDGKPVAALCVAYDYFIKYGILQRDEAKIKEAYKFAIQELKKRHPNYTIEQIKSNKESVVVISKAKLVMDFYKELDKQGKELKL